jgi:hypothetical protein
MHLLGRTCDQVTRLLLCSKNSHIECRIDLLVCMVPALACILDSIPLEPHPGRVAVACA